MYPLDQKQQAYRQGTCINKTAFYLTYNFFIINISVKPVFPTILSKQYFLCITNTSASINTSICSLLFLLQRSPVLLEHFHVFFTNHMCHLYFLHLKYGCPARCALLYSLTHSHMSYHAGHKHSTLLLYPAYPVRRKKNLDMPLCCKHNKLTCLCMSPRNYSAFFFSLRSLFKT